MIPKPHQRFVAQCTHWRYFPDSPYFVDDEPPFGTDTGSDEFHTWAEQADDLVRHPTLRHALGDPDDQELLSWFAAGDEFDERLIADAFVLLYLTGRLDAQGQIWLAETLERQATRYGDPYSQMLEDVSPFLTQRGTRKPGKVHQWLRIQAWNVPELDPWLKSVARGIQLDPTWDAWWAASGRRSLQLLERIAPDDDDPIRVAEDRAGRLTTVGLSGELSRDMNRAEQANEDLDDWLTYPITRQMYLDLTLKLLTAVGDHAGVPAPERLPTSVAV